jgi:Subtilase family
MNEIPKPRLLLKTHPATGTTLAQKNLALRGTTFHIVEPLCPNESVGNPLALSSSSRWYLAEADPNGMSVSDLWDLAHVTVCGQELGLEVAAGAIYAEPDLPYHWLYENDAPVVGELGVAPGDFCAYKDQRGNPLAQGPGFAWHLGSEFSGLKHARDEVAKLEPANVRIAIMDVGFDFRHRTFPKNVLFDLQRNFVDDGQSRNDASDLFLRGKIKNPGHGTGTIGLLAGNILKDMARPEQNTNDYLGGAPLAQIIPLRIASSVILLYTSAFAQALDYVLAPNGAMEMRADIVSMSMGGLASRAWTDVVNRAYEAGVCLVTAAGNNLGDTPKRIVFPARYHRVIAACGVMANHEKYADLPAGVLQGSYGPKSKMETALAAYTPNMPWAEINCEKLIDMDGSGTSSATPQIAAAAALWLQKHARNLNYPEPWMIVEAIRNALFTKAYLSRAENRTYLGRGILKAADSLQVGPSANLSRTDPDSASFSFLRVLTGLGLVPPAQSEMLQIEASQLMQRHREIEDTIVDPDLPAEQIPRDQIKAFFQAVLSSSDASQALKAHVQQQYLARFKRDVSLVVHHLLLLRIHRMCLLLRANLSRS